MNSIISAKKGNNVAFVWLLMIVFIFLFATIYIIFNEPFNIVDESTVSLYNQTEYGGTVSKIKTVWVLLPVFVLLFVVIWAIYSSGGSNQDLQ